jgi:hypothetical protein
MTTPAQGPVLSASADKASYAVGDPLTLTVTYSDSNSVAQDLTITVTGSDSAGNTASSAVTVQVITEGTPGPMDIGATDSFGDTYSVASNDGSSTAVLTTTVGSPPVINPL